MGSRNYTTTQTSTDITDRRVAVGDNGILFNATEGSDLSYNSSTVINNQSLDSVSIKAALDGAGVITGQNNETLKEISAKAIKAASDAAADQARTVAAAADASIAASRAALGSSLDFARDTTGDFLKYTAQVNNGFIDVAGDLNRLVGQEGNANRDFATSLVGSVLEQSRTSDERNIDTFLKTAVWIVGIVAVVIVGPQLVKGVK